MYIHIYISLSLYIYIYIYVITYTDTHNILWAREVSRNNLAVCLSAQVLRPEYVYSAITYSENPIQRIRIL